MSERPDWVKCALTGMRDGPDKPIRETWCGRSAEFYEWCFVDATHAALNAKRGGRLVLCADCVRAIIAVLQTQLPDYGIEK